MSIICIGIILFGKDYVVILRYMYMVVVLEVNWKWGLDL